MAVVAAGLVAMVVGSATAAGASAPSPHDQLRSFVCQKALDPPTRAVSIQAVMRPVTGTAKMQIRFDLMRKTKPDAPFKIVRGHFLGSWLTPDNPTLGQRPGDVWIVNHPVVGLPAPATYRFRVSFRWMGASGQQLSSAVQSSPSCYQPELRADLLVRSLTVTPLASGKSSYVAVIGNRGLAAAGPVEVDLAGVSTTTQAQTLASVGPKSSARERFVAPACTPGANLAVTVDPSHTIDEYDFANNVLTMPCPAPSPSS
ncbi:MAG: CARDB domain-containing protein [Solirubrobacteraceae bacterium]